MSETQAGPFSEGVPVECDDGFYSIHGRTQPWAAVMEYAVRPAKVRGPLKGWGHWTHVVEVWFDDDRPALYFAG